jgi:hypothetical protein
MNANRSLLYSVSALSACVGLVAALGLSTAPVFAQDSDVRACLKGCRETANACNDPVESARKSCGQTCRTDMKTVLQGCKTGDDPAACIGNAFAGAETCHDGCREIAQSGHETCFDAANDCITVCTPTQGACIVGCRETTRNCRQAAYGTAYTCKSTCRDVMVTELQGCASDPDRATCAKAARDAFKSCKTPCQSTLRSDMSDCKTQVKSCRGTCASAQ